VVIRERPELQAKIASALNLLNIIRQETDRIGVAMSFGKDSLTTLDLCSQIFPAKNIKAFYLYRVEGLIVIERWRKYVEKRWGVETIMLPHFDLSRIYRNAVLMPNWKGLEETPRITMRMIEDYFRKIMNLTWIAYGWRRNDSINRAVIMKRWAGFDYENFRVFPIWLWKRREVYSYLEAKEIMIPPKLGREEQGGFDFHPGALRYLKEHSPGDWRKWLRDFPYSEVMLLHAGWRKRRRSSRLGE